MIALSLTPRELEVARMIQQGRKFAAIGEALGISAGTVKSFSSRIYSKLGITGTTREIREKLKKVELG